MQRYFVNEISNDVFILNDSDSYHISHVMRMKKGDLVEIIYNRKLYICDIISFNPVLCKIKEKMNNYETDKPNVIIAQALVKEQKMDYILQKSCELGAFSIIPIKTERSIIKINNEIDKKIQRWNKILKEASEQSKRLSIPILDKIIDIKELTNVDAKYKLICSVNEKSKSIKSVLSNVNISDTILFVIGPEGGFSREEEDYLVYNGFISVSFGDNVLRTETASSYILSVVSYEFMR